jgi:hypothetical protein
MCRADQPQALSRSHLDHDALCRFKNYRHDGDGRLAPKGDIGHTWRIDRIGAGSGLSAISRMNIENSRSAADPIFTASA